MSAKLLDFPTDMEAFSKGSVIDRPDLQRLAVSGAAVEYRRQGAFITRVALGGESLLWSDFSTLNDGQMRATHATAPHGPSNLTGGQHGVLRRADYEQKPNMGGPAAIGVEILEAQKTAGISVSQSMILGKNAYTHSVAFSRHPEIDERATSAGMHWYFEMSADQVGDLKINGVDLREFSGQDDCIENIMGGHAVFVAIDSPAPGVDPAIGSMQVAVDIPEKPAFDLSAAARGAVLGDGGQKGVMLWAHEAGESICIEPVFGWQGKNDPNDPNAGLILNAPITAINYRISLQNH